MIRWFGVVDIFEGDDRFCQVCCSHPNHQVNNLGDECPISAPTPPSLSLAHPLRLLQTQTSNVACYPILEFA